MNAIEIDNIAKSYDQLTVLRRLNLHVPTSQAYGLLGTNGVGKSTLIHLILGFTRPDSGTIRVLSSSDLERTRSRIGYLPERLRYHMRYSGREYLRFLGRFSDMSGRQLNERVEWALQLVGLKDAADRHLSTYSKGMLQRFGIAQALLSDPELLIIDEPTSGLDPSGQREMIDLLSDLRATGRTIFMATHIIEEAELLCDYVGILNNGTITANIDVHALRVPGNHIQITVNVLPADLILRLQTLGPAVRCSNFQITLHPNTPELQASVLRMLLDAQVAIISLDPQVRPLEDLFLRVVRGEYHEIPTSDSSGPKAIDEIIPNGWFAPPGHPEFLPRDTVKLDDEPISQPQPIAVRRPGETLLRELLADEQFHRPDKSQPEQDSEK